MASDFIMADAVPGDRLKLSKYLKTPVQVVGSEISMAGRVLLVESSGGTIYRIRAVDDDDDRLLLEKRATVGGWNPFIRLDAMVVRGDEDGA